MDRSRDIIRVSIIGVIGNLFLGAFKFIVGQVTNSIAIITDAVNNLTDSLSSIVIIVGTRLSEKEPDRKHPFGYGRVEYITTLIIGGLIMYAGITAFLESFHQILHPEPSEYSLRALLIVIAALVVKICLGIYTKRKGAELDSASLTASGRDSIEDSLETAAAFIAAVIHVKAGISLEAYVGIAISVVILRTGLETLRETLSSILGERVEAGLAAQVRDSILSFPEIDGVFDLVIHNYGKEKLYGSAHIEVADVLTAAWIDNLQRAVTNKVLKDTGVEMLGLTIYAENSRDAEIAAMKKAIRNIVEDIPHVTGMYGFYLDKIDKEIKFDVVTDFDAEDSRIIEREIAEKAAALYPDHNISIRVTKDIAS